MAKMSEREKERLTWIAALAVGVIVLFWLWYRWNNAAGASPLAQSAASGNPVVLGAPAPNISLSFQTPANAFTNQPTGYVPLFGFIGYGTQWQ